MGRERLRRRKPLPLRAPLRNAAFFDRPYWLARIAVEHEDETLLGRLYHHVARTVAGVDARQRRLRRYIVVPHVVMHGLKRPHQFSALAAQRSHGIGMFVVANPLAAPKVRAR